ncbi:Serine/threonine-protein kinase rio2 [Colletotrichum orbiculare MAFF 240422]|uniref:Serine/threonine-protein kinase RIO2 n=1 Tax=Colletotrichum orbiculare (strain 104-T / ATCC 96160 / CBS 514.97 / LARS 414 / MAFF 240422) TaxID=1213857 RepID=N4VNI6_COLOR|nr:Serine/threonine-protein kinase rio2 [Colletotrichum orbiculare MAFF 240422]
MHLDTKALRHLAAEDWRVLAAVEQGSKNHELVPTPLIEKLSRLRGGVNGVHRCISNLAKVGLIAKVKEAKYDGYRLSYGGLDYLAMHTYSTRKEVYSVGSRVGVGKESDIVMVADDRGKQLILKIHRLGRISFRTVKSNRDYLKNKQSGSWMYLSRLAAMKEFAFMKALRNEGFPVPEPIAQNRHTIVMSFIDSFPLRQISAIPDPATLYAELIELILRLAKHGLIHGDFNEFNILIKEEVTTTTRNEGEEETIKLIPVVIDFPQMVSMEHTNAEMYFDRDVNCIKRFFEKRFHFVSTTPGPFFKDAKKTVGKDGATRLDATVEASGFTKKMAKDLEKAIEAQTLSKDDDGENDEGSDDYDYDSEDDDDEAEEQVEAREEGDDASASGTAEVDAKTSKQEEELDTQKFSKLAVTDVAS